MTDQFIFLGDGGSSGSGFTAGGDLSGTSSSQTLINIQGLPIDTSTGHTNGNVLTYDSASGELKLLGTFAAGGDLTGTLTSQTVQKIQGVGVLVSPLTDGYVLTYSASGGFIQLAAPTGGGGGGFTPPTGTGFAHLTSGVLDGASKLVADADVSGTAAIVYSKLALSNSILNADINSSAAIAYSKLNLTGDIVNADVNSAAAIAGTKISPNFGSQFIQTSGNAEVDGYIRIGSGTVPTTGALRVATGGVTAALSVTSSTNTSREIITWNGTDNLQFGVGAFNEYFFSNSLTFNTASVTTMVMTSTKTTTGFPLEIGGGTYAAAGIFRVSNNPGTILAQRNAGNSADLVALSLNATDGYLGSSTTLGTTTLSNIHIAPSTQTDIYAGSTQLASFTSGLTTLIQPVAFGATPSTTGQLRFSNNEFLKWRNQPNSADLQIIGVDASSVLQIGENSGSFGGFNINSHSAVPINITSGGSNRLTIANTKLTSAVSLEIGGGTYAAAGIFRVANAQGTILAQRNAGNSADQVLLAADASNIGLLGSVSAGSGSGVISIANATTAPTTNPTGGLVAYVDAADGYFKTRTAAGQVLALNGAVPSGALTDSLHQAERQLIHFIDNGPANGFGSTAYREVTSSPFPTSVIWWDSPSKLTKLVEKDYSYNSNRTTNTVTWKMFASDGTTVLATVTDTLTYSGVFETSRSRTIA